MRDDRRLVHPLQHVRRADGEFRIRARDRDEANVGRLEVHETVDGDVGDQRIGVGRQRKNGASRTALLALNMSPHTWVSTMRLASA